MKEIIFHGLGLNFKINNIAINIGNISIYWYAILIVIAFIIAIVFLKKDDGKYNIKFDEDLLELICIIIPISIISARVYYVLFKLKEYVKNPISIFYISDGGLAIYGGIIGAIITTVIYCKIKKINIFDVLDYMIPYLPLGQAIGRWGNFFNVEAHGRNTNSILRMGIIENNQYMEVHPTFFYESVCNLVIFCILFKLKNKRKYKGQLLYLYLAMYGFVRAIIEGLRTDSLMLCGFRISQILSIMICLIASSILIFNKRKMHNE